METFLGAITRLRNFIQDTPREDSGVDGLTATYYLEDETKVGICGRTGSGKSSLLLSLLKLLETQLGSIIINGLDLASVPSVVPRTHLTALPQDSVTLPGTVRTNLDPLETVAADKILIDALSSAGIWETISSRGGLDAQKVLQEVFKKKTVLVVAHRLETIADLDLVIVIDKERIVEVGDPRELKSKPDSLF
ncbi:putative ATP-binding cassette transporter [Cadophora sp. MPI-SDFR-AT-0126]|nr:putative ATP-binding cassette transporter [Leotiomycetes sp. MPI-SDFR-AT-0126]